MSGVTGYIDFTRHGETYKTWFRIFGDLHCGIRPLVILHGGPGMGVLYLEKPHVELFTQKDIPLIFYDQLGAGRSTHLPHKPEDFWTIELFMDELDNVLSHFEVADNFDLLGHSWGGMLAADYATIRQPKGLKRLIIADSPASMPLWGKCLTRLLETGYPEDFVKMLRRHEREGTTNDPEYQEGMVTFYKRQICTLDPWPKALQEAFAESAKDDTVYHIMSVVISHRLKGNVLIRQTARWGTSEWNLSGSLHSWTVEDRLHTITCPTLVINGLDDEAQDECVYPFFERIPKVKWVRFDKSSHLPFWEEEERYMEVVGGFLKD